MFHEMELCSSSIKKSLYFFQKKAFLMFPEMDPALFKTRLEKKKKLPSKKVLIISGNATFWLYYSYISEITYISGNGNPKIRLIFQEVTFQARKNKKKIHLKKICYTSGNGNPEKTSDVFSKESFSYISGNGNPDNNVQANLDFRNTMIIY